MLKRALDYRQKLNRLRVPLTDRYFVISNHEMLEVAQAQQLQDVIDEPNDIIRVYKFNALKIRLYGLQLVVRTP